MRYSFKYPEWFKDVEKLELRETDKIFLWGAGKVGTVVAHVLEMQGYEILGFVDSDLTKTGTKVYGYKVFAPEEYYALNENTVTIVSCAFPSVITLLEEKGIKAYSPHSLLLDFDFEGYRGELTPKFLARLVDNAIRNYAMFFKKGRLIERLFFVITEKCTLKCKNCDAYMPYHHRPKQTSYDEVVRNYNAILDVCGYVDSIDVLGGEPLLHPDLDMVLEYLISDKRCGTISVISNGTIIPNPKVVKCLKNEKCIFRLSDYGKLSKHKDVIIDLLEREQIRYEITNYQYWDEIPRVGLVNETEQQLNLKFATCTGNAMYVKGNMACYCTFLSALYGVDFGPGKEAFPNYNSNVVMLDKGAETKRELVKYISNLHERKAIDACKYCPGAHCIQFGEKVLVAEQAEGFLPVEQLYRNGKGL